ncbi:hypothetical protein [Pseudocolwellia sp. HL-MZ7]
MSDARQLLADMDKILNQQLGNKAIESTVNNLNKIQALVSGKYL